jgi:hypothetical protein
MRTAPVKLRINFSRSFAYQLPASSRGYQLSTLNPQLLPRRASQPSTLNSQLFAAKRQKSHCAYRGSMISSPPLNEINTTWVHSKSGGKPKSQSTNAKSG